MAIWRERDDDLESLMNRSALWAVSYGDLMSFLVIFFLLMYSSVMTRSVSLQMSMQSVSDQFSKEGKVTKELFSKYGIQQLAKLEVRENRLRIVFNAPILFDSGSAVMKESAIPYIIKLTDALSELPNPIQIEGHTDNRPLIGNKKFDSNWELSSARAFAVLRALEINGIPSHRLSAIGYGEYRPIKSNETEDGRMANRRIELNIMRMED
ncbi:MAG: OmpA family protein [Elusimicrobiota bacterium]|jgi:chemotaxis protein MotB